MTIEYTTLFDQTFRGLGFDLVPQWNGFDPPYNAISGWPLKLPKTEFKANTLVLIHFQDFVTFDNDKIVELDAVEKFYGSHANQVVVTHMHHGLEKIYHGPVNLIEYSNHNCREMTRLAQRWHECSAAISQPKTKAWQCLNGRMCLHRRRVVDILQNWHNGWLSYGTEICLPSWNYATYRGTENDENFVRLLPVYGTAAVNIVTETQYDHRPGVICEKTLFAMAAQQIPILIGYPGIVADCKDMGLDVFDDVVDTSYDFLPNNQRVEQAILRNKDLIQGKIDLEKFQQRLQKQSQYVLNDLIKWYQNKFVQQAMLCATKIL
jgi:hypothetical protein